MSTAEQKKIERLLVRANNADRNGPGTGTGTYLPAYKSQNGVRPAYVSTNSKPAPTKLDDASKPLGGGSRRRRRRTSRKKSRRHKRR